MTMQELGEMFQAARENAGLSLEEVNEKTKISLYVLESLERGEGDRLPHPVYTKGFIRSYAELLGLDKDMAVQEYLDAVGPLDDLEMETGHPELNVRRRRGGKNGKLWLILLVLAVLAAGVWLVVSHVSREIEPVAPVALEDNTTLLDQEGEMQEEGMQDNGAGANETLQGEFPAPADGSLETPEPADVSQGASPASDSLSGDEPAEPVSRGETSLSDQDASRDLQETAMDQAPSETPLATAPAAPSQEVVAAATPSREEVSDAPRAHMLRIEATHECWMRAVADGDTAPHKIVRLLEPGQSASLSFDQKVDLRLGNAGGVRLFVDDEPYAFEAVLGGVKTLEITAPVD